MAFWEDTLRYLYLPRLKNRDSLTQAIRTGAASTDFFGTAYGQEGDKYTGFHVGEANVQFDDTLLLIDPAAASEYAAALKRAKEAEEAAKKAAEGTATGGSSSGGSTTTGTLGQTTGGTATGGGTGLLALAQHHNRNQSLSRLDSDQALNCQDAFGSSRRRDHRPPRRRSKRISEHHARNQRRIPFRSLRPNQASSLRKRDSTGIQDKVLGVGQRS